MPKPHGIRIVRHHFMIIKGLKDKDRRDRILAALDAYEKCSNDPLDKRACQIIYREIRQNEEYGIDGRNKDSRMDMPGDSHIDSVIGARGQGINLFRDIESILVK